MKVKKKNLKLCLRLLFDFENGIVFYFFIENDFLFCFYYFFMIYDKFRKGNIFTLILSFYVDEDKFEILKQNFLFFKRKNNLPVAIVNFFKEKF